MKNILENALLSLFISNKEDDQNDNINLLKVNLMTITPFIKLNFNNNELNKKELIDTYSSYVYIKNYKKSLNKFIDEFKSKIPKEEVLKKHIKDHINNHNIYFSNLPEKIIAISIHTGDIYLRVKDLKEYYEEKEDDKLIIIKEKIILNIAHELNHLFLREIDEEMKDNFFLQSYYKKKVVDRNLKFINKFNEKKIHYLDLDESGNLFDFHFFNRYYFDELYSKEANFFSDIKNIKSLKNYNEGLVKIIDEEKIKTPLSLSINKFKKIDSEVRRCIKSRILKVEYLDENIDTRQFCKLLSDESDYSEDNKEEYN